MDVGGSIPSLGTGGLSNADSDSVGKRICPSRYASLASSGCRKQLLGREVTVAKTKKKRKPKSKSPEMPKRKLSTKERIAAITKQRDEAVAALQQTQFQSHVTICAAIEQLGGPLVFDINTQQRPELRQEVNGSMITLAYASDRDVMEIESIPETSPEAVDG